MKNDKLSLSIDAINVLRAKTKAKESFTDEDLLALDVLLQMLLHVLTDRKFKKHALK